MTDNKQAKASDDAGAADNEAAEGFAADISRWGMSAPALVALAVGKPLGYFGAQLLYVGGPLLRVLDFAVGSKLATRASSLAHLLENPAALEQLTARLEQQEGERR